MVEPADGAAGDLEALLDGEVDTAVGDYNVAALTEGGDDGGDGRERLRV